MTGARVTYDVDDTAIRAALGSALDAVSNPKPMLDEIGARLELSVARRFETETGPTGAAWTPSRRAAREGGKTLTETGRLNRSITRAVREREVLVGTNLVYAAIHQFGGEIKQAARTQRLFIDDDRGEFVSGRARRGGPQRIVDAALPARTIQFPARPFLGVSDDDRSAIIEIARRHIVGASS